MKKINPEHIRRVIEIMNASPYFSLLGIQVTKMEPGYAQVIIDCEQKHMNPFGSLHGGTLTSLSDTACYWAAYCDQPEDVGFTSLDVNVTLLSMVRGGRITAEARVIKDGRSICLTESVIKDEYGNVAASGTSKLMKLHNKQNLAVMLETMGYEYIPPKFIEE